MQTPNLQVLESLVGGGGGEDIEQPNDLMEERIPHLNLESICCARGTQVAALHRHTQMGEHQELHLRNLRTPHYAAQLLFLLLMHGRTHYTSAPAWCQLGAAGRQQSNAETTCTCQTSGPLN